MTQSPLLSRVEQTLGHSFARVLDPEAHFHDPEIYPDSYRAVMTVGEEMARDGNGNTAFLDAEGRLRGLNLYNCQLDPERMQELLKLDLPDLQVLNLLQTGLTRFVFSEQQPRLQHVKLSQNESLTDIRFPNTPQELLTLELYDCRVSALDLPGGLNELRKLDAARNEHLARVSFPTACPKLSFLDLSENQLSALHLPSGFGELQYVFLRKNQLKELTFGGGFQKLETLDLRANQLKELPDNFLETTGKLTHLFLYENPWESIKDAVSSEERANSCEAVQSFLTSLQGPVDYLFEAKMILVGNGEVGKTSIRRKLIDESAPLPEKDDRTRVVEIDRYVVENIPPELTGQSLPKDFVFNIWDFAGQGRYREIQQIFCSHQSLYLFVTAWDDQPERKKEKEDYVSFEYWLDMVSAYGHNEEADEGSPILIVINKIEGGKYASVDKARFLQDYPHIHPRDVYISCTTLMNFPQLRAAIVELIPSISPDIFTTKRNTRWLAVKQALEARKAKKYLSYEQYLDLCRKPEHGLDDRAARTWLGMLDRIGTVIHFDQNPQLKDWIILDPEWVREALESILKHESLHEFKGVLKPSLMKLIWGQHNEPERAAFLRLMLAYKLCYERKDQHGKPEYLVPACLPSEEPNLPGFLHKPSYRIRFSYQPFVPAGTVNKLMVSMQRGEEIRAEGPELEGLEGEKLAGKRSPIHGKSGEHITVYDNKMWKNQVVYHDALNDAYAHVAEDWDHRMVRIDLFGEAVRPLFERLEAVLTQLNAELKATRYIRSLHFKVEIEDDGSWLDLDYFRKRKALFFKETPMTVQELIAKGRIREALDKLLNSLSGQAKSEATLLQSRLSSLERDTRLGTKSNADSNVERNQIVAAILSLDNDRTQNPTIDPTKPPIPPPVSDRKIYFSYAWKDIDPEGDETQKIIDQLFNSLKKDGYQVARDQEDLPYGGIISEYMQDLGAAPLILVFTSPHYFHSPFCMYELCEIGRNATWNKNIFRTRILPVMLEHVNFSRPSSLTPYIKHWKKEEQEWADFFQEHSSGEFQEQNELYGRIIDINRNIGKLGAWLNDINASTLKLVAENDFSLIKQTILERLSQLDA